MTKYRSIQQLLDQVAGPLARAGVGLCEDWQTQEEAVGFASALTEGLSAYVYTYGQAAGCYGIQLEFPEPDGPPLLPVPTSAEHLSLASVVQMLLEHFDVPVMALA